jgi:hypothetical protein
MPRWNIECKSWDCESCEMQSALNPKNREKCPTTGELVITATKSQEEDDTNYVEKTSKASPRPSWESGRRQEIRERATSPGGTLYCQLCGDEIEVNARGKEEWTSKSGNQHETSPHIDHYKKDWVVRKRTLVNSSGYQNADTSTQKQMLREKYNDSPLRTVHMECNLCRAKATY